MHRNICTLYGMSQINKMMRNKMEPQGSRYLHEKRYKNREEEK